MLLQHVLRTADGVGERNEHALRLTWVCMVQAHGKIPQLPVYAGRECAHSVGCWVRRDYAAGVWFRWSYTCAQLSVEA